MKDLEFLSNAIVEGESLADRLTQGVLPPEEALQYAIDIGAALTRAHVRGIVHGQLSSHAILLTNAGARILQPARCPHADTAPYRSPEQVSDAAADWRSDIFAFGVLVFEMANGRRPFAGDGPELDHAILHDPPAATTWSSATHAAMEEVITGCLEKDPARRRQRIQNAVIELKLARQAVSRLAATVHPHPLPEPVPPPLPSAVAAAAVQPPPSGETAPPAMEGRPIMAEAIEPRPAHTEFLPLAVDDLPQLRAAGFRRRLVFLGPVFLAVAATAVAAVLYLHQKPAPVYNFAVAPPERSTYRMPAVSPDGRSLIVSAQGPEGKAMLWLRHLDEMSPFPIPGTEGGVAPFWSPDSRFVAFFANQSLKKVRVAGGPVQTICAAQATPGGGAWNRSGVILFSPSQGDTLYRVSAAGSRPQPVLQLNTAKFERAHLWPQFLPDGKHFVFFVLSDLADLSGVYAGSLDSPEYRMLFPSDTNAVYSTVAGAGTAAKGYLLFIRNRSLLAQPFNAARLALDGDAVPLADDIGSVQSLSLAPISVSGNAVLAYQTVGRPSWQLTWMDRAGNPLATVGQAGAWGTPRISPDGSRAVAARIGLDGVHANLWIADQAGHVTQLTDTPAHEGSPVWSPDGSHIAYFSNQEVTYDIYSSPVDGSGKPQLVFRNTLPKNPTDWSRDGKYILFDMLGEGTGLDAWAVSLADHRAAPLVDTVYSEGHAALSPDGKWLAFQSDESRRNEVYVQPFGGLVAGTQRRWQVSTSGGALPRWSAGGKELFYMTSSGQLMAVPVHPHGDEFEFDSPQMLFQVRPLPNNWNLYDATPDGMRFLVNVPMEWSNSPINIWTAWTEKLKGGDALTAR